MDCNRAIILYPLDVIFLLLIPMVRIRETHLTSVKMCKHGNHSIAMTQAIANYKGTGLHFMSDVAQLD